MLQAAVTPCLVFDAVVSAPGQLCGARSTEQNRTEQNKYPRSDVSCCSGAHREGESTVGVGGWC